MDNIIYPVPIWIINLRSRRDRLSHINSEFSGRTEFLVHVVPAVEDEIGGYGLIRTIVNILEKDRDSGQNFTIICEDDHVFTTQYDKLRFYNLLVTADKINADVLIGGPSSFDYGVDVHEDLFWLNTFTGCQFIVVFKRFYETLLSYTFNKFDNIDLVISKLSNRKFTVNPMISIQKGFGYSDIAFNSEDRSVDQLYRNSISRLETYDKLNKYFQTIDFDFFYDYDIKISTYVVNLTESVDRLEFIKEEFKNKQEFEISTIKVCENNNEEVRLWSSIREIINIAINSEEDVIIICDDKHIFTKEYNKNILFNAIYQGAVIGADIILGGISNANQAIVVNPILCWIDSFRSTQFIIVYKQFFKKILEEEFKKSDTVDLKLSMMTINKYVIHPFISLQCDFEYSDIPIMNSDNVTYEKWFKDCDEKLKKIRNLKRLQFSN